jgi:hypothetical protein
MVRRLAAVLALPLSTAAASAQLPAGPVPLFPAAAPPRSLEAEPLPPPFSDNPRSARSTPAPEVPAAAGTAAERVFCEQAVTVRLGERESVPERYRGFVGIWSDAAWTPQLCAALIVEHIAPDGTARVTYAFGPIGSNAHGPGGVLNGTGVVRNGELRFQNSDGSQFAFRPLYSDLDGRLTTPQGQTFQAIFKKTL